VLTLWDLIEPIRRALSPAADRPARRTPASPRRAGAATSAQARYDQIVREMVGAYGLRVRRWRRSMSGVAWVTRYRDGSAVRCLESPRPKSPLSLAIFLHEVGHHAIGLGSYKPRCLEEYHAWMFALREMERLGVPVTDRVRRRVQRSLKYAADKARRRGLRHLPEELRAYC
jgi:hypothetical protein